jgi:hypothetical protein
MDNLVPAEMKLWIDCKHCGRTDKQPVAIQIPPQLAFREVEKVCVTCERCAGPATLYMERRICRAH